MAQRKTLHTTTTTSSSTTTTSIIHSFFLFPNRVWFSKYIALAAVWDVYCGVGASQRQDVRVL